MSKYINYLKSRFVKKPITVQKLNGKIVISIETSNDNVFKYIKKEFCDLFKNEIKSNKIVLKLKRKRRKN